MKNKSLEELANGLSTAHPKEMRKIKNGFEGDRSNMKELTFEITTVQTEKCINGSTIIAAKCVQDDLDVEIQVANLESSNKELVREKLMKEHDRLVRVYKNPIIAVGDII